MPVNGNSSQVILNPACLLQKDAKGCRLLTIIQISLLASEKRDKHLLA